MNLSPDFPTWSEITCTSIKLGIKTRDIVSAVKVKITLTGTVGIQISDTKRPKTFEYQTV